MSSQFLEKSLVVRPSDERGKADHGWLVARHSFSFADYLEPAHHHFRSLRVINEDRIAPAMGFGTHAHRDMEIITYPISGALEHKDSMDNGSIITSGEVQYMSAGSGVTHSEFNPSKSDPTHLLQIWIMPVVKGAPPRYAQRRFEDSEKLNQLCLIVAGNVKEGSAAIGIRQDATIYASVLEQNKKLEYQLAAGRGLWLQVISGSIGVENTILSAGDGAKLEGYRSIQIAGKDSRSEFLLFDLH